MLILFFFVLFVCSVFYWLPFKDPQIKLFLVKMSRDDIASPSIPLQFWLKLISSEIIKNKYKNKPTKNKKTVVNRAWTCSASSSITQCYYFFLVLLLIKQDLCLMSSSTTRLIDSAIFNFSLLHHFFYLLNSWFMTSCKCWVTVNFQRPQI